MTEYKPTWSEIWEEAKRDPRLRRALVRDGIGALNYLGWAFGGVPGALLAATDIAYSVYQTSYIARTYGDELGSSKWPIYLFSVVEELGCLDFVPTTTIAHCIAAKNRLKEAANENRSQINQSYTNIPVDQQEYRSREDQNNRIPNEWKSDIPSQWTTPTERKSASRRKKKEE